MIFVVFCSVRRVTCKSRYDLWSASRARRFCRIRTAIVIAARSGRQCLAARETAARRIAANQKLGTRHLPRSRAQQTKIWKESKRAFRKTRQPFQLHGVPPIFLLLLVHKTWQDI